MFALHSAVALTCLIAAAGRRHSDSYLTPEVGQAEEKTAEALESITPHGGDGHLTPLSASFQVAPTMGDMPVKTRMTLLMSHVSTAASEIGIVCQLTAKDEVSATNFAQALTDFYAAQLESKSAPPVTWHELIALRTHEEHGTCVNFHELIRAVYRFYVVLPCFTTFYPILQMCVAYRSIV